MSCNCRGGPTCCYAPSFNRIIGPPWGIEIPGQVWTFPKGKKRKNLKTK